MMVFFPIHHFPGRAIRATAGLLLFLALGAPPPAPAQSRLLWLPGGQPLDPASILELQRAPLGLFDAEEPLGYCLITDFDGLLDSGAESAYRPATLWMDFGDSLRLEFDLKLRPRGNTRLESCYYPPLRLNFDKDDMRLPALRGLDKIKKVAPCQRGEHYQHLVLREYLAYRLYNLITPFSLRVRLLRMEWKDEDPAEPILNAFGFLIEEDDELARRFDWDELTRDTLDFVDLEPSQLGRMALFEFMIGNVDWSVPGRHNLMVFAPQGGGPGLPVPYDFDFANLVNANYPERGEAALELPLPPPQYKGPCLPDDLLDELIEDFRSRREAMRELIDGFDLLPRIERDDMLDQLEAFFRLLEQPQRLRQRLRGPCP